MKETIKLATKTILIYFVFGFLFVQFFSSLVFKIFSETDSGVFIDYGSYAFKIISYGFLLVGFQIVVSAVFQSLGYSIRAMIVTISRQILFFIPLAYILTYFFSDMKGIWFAFAISDLLSGVMSLFLLVFEMRRVDKYSEDLIPIKIN